MLARFLLSLCAILCAFLTWSSAHAQIVKTPHVEARLVARDTGFVPGQAAEVALRLEIIPHWHTYWRNPGDSGLPTRLKWTLPEGFAAGEIEWPYPKKLPLGPLMNFGYEGTVLHVVRITTPAAARIGQRYRFEAKADWLVCADVCIPEEGVVSLDLVAREAASVKRSVWDGEFLRTASMTPTQILSAAETRIRGNEAELRASGKFDGVVGASFFPFRDDVIANAGVQRFTPTAAGFTLSIPLAEPRNNELKVLEGVIVAQSSAGDARWPEPILAAAANVKAPVSYGVSTTTKNIDAPSGLSFALAIGLGLLGGLILNLMPCVFPVLGIKVMSFVDHAHGDVRLLRTQGLLFTGGVLVSFLTLAGIMLGLRSAGESIGWGFQLQEPLFVAALAVVFFVMGLNLAGIFEIGTSLQTVAGDAEQRAQSSPWKGAFASGVLATVVATPCMAPGLGASVGYTIGQPVFVALLVFVAIALGLALPVLMLSWFPALLRWMPRPGVWMETFKQFMAFPMFATVVWLVWVLGSQTGNDGAAKLLAGLTAIALACWAWGRWQRRSTTTFLGVAIVFFAVGLSGAWLGARTVMPAARAATAGGWVAFSPEAIESSRRDGKAVFVDFTATWCITCQVNKRVALDQPEVVAKMKAMGVVRMQADWTRKDPIITEALARFGRNGVPLYVLYPASGDPVVLPELLTPSVVLDHLAKLERT
jgi:thiol:disulfide interchange protein